MCIAIYSNYGDQLPTEDTLEYCFQTNSDGGGFGYLTKEKQWHVRKGFMTFDDFMKAYNEHDFKVEDAVVIHFRIGTSGRCPDKAGELGKGEFCTHPFPMKRTLDELEQLEYTTDRIVVHNGVVGKGAGYWSDTMEHIRDYIEPMFKYAVQDANVWKIFEELVDAGARYHGSRWFLAKEDTYYLVGGWVEDKDTGIMYSHSGYKPYQYVVRHGYGAHGDEEWWHYSGIDTTDHNSNWVYRDGAWHLKDRAPKTEVKVKTFDMSDRKAEEFLSIMTGWNWKEFDTCWAEDFTIEDAEAIPPNEDEDDDDSITNLYDSNGTSILAMVDDFGNVVWDDVTRIMQKPEDVANAASNNYANLNDDDTLHPCHECGASELRKADLEKSNNGDRHCPFCHTTIIPAQTKSEFSCPNCGEVEYLGEPMMDRGDTQCYRCGAVFLDTIKGKDGIVCWDEEIKAKHETIVESLGNVK
jgi:predicted RNA-binding Zn-ribbon protein involved in translation (DUF1610 family)